MIRRIKNVVRDFLKKMHRVEQTCILPTDDNVEVCVVILPQNPIKNFGWEGDITGIWDLNLNFYNLCGECEECVRACPVGAFTGRDFQPDEPREARFDAAACDRYFKSLKQKGRVAVCGMCLYICPHGMKQEHEKIT